MTGDGRADPAADATAAVAVPEPAATVEPRPLPLRLAGLHLRMGSLALARAELESFAGAGTLDEPALLDLAEARWRTGDLAGAGEAANAALGRGIADPLAYVIAAEAVASVGRPAEARRLAGHALEGLQTTLDALFAGMPRSLIWPSDPSDAAAEAGTGAPASHRARDADGGSPASAAAAEAFAGGRAALAAGDVTGAAVRLGVAIRLEPQFAQGVLTAIGERASVPLLSLVAGDALRLLGREHEALEAYHRARGRSPSDGEESAAAGAWTEDDEGPG